MNNFLNNENKTKNDDQDEINRQCIIISYFP